jgi:MFS family permease
MNANYRNGENWFHPAHVSPTIWAMTPSPDPQRPVPQTLRHPHPATQGRRHLIVGLGVVVVPLDSSVNIAFPYMTDHFAIGVSDTKLIVISFILTSISLLLIAGRAGDVWGHRLVFQAGLVISAVGLALVALAPTFPVLLAARVLQGTGRRYIGTGFLLP